MRPSDNLFFFFDVTDFIRTYSFTDDTTATPAVLLLSVLVTSEHLQQIEEERVKEIEGDSGTKEKRERRSKRKRDGEIEKETEKLDKVGRDRALMSIVG